VFLDLPWETLVHGWVVSDAFSHEHVLAALNSSLTRDGAFALRW
jgi:hypothetical protein